jgi:hypothetical protein
MHACVHRGECSYVYKYLSLYCVSKKKILTILYLYYCLGANICFNPFPITVEPVNICQRERK